MKEIKENFTSRERLEHFLSNITFTYFSTDINTLLILHFYLHATLKLLKTQCLHEPFPATWIMYKFYNCSKFTCSLCLFSYIRAINFAALKPYSPQAFSQKEKTKCNIVLSGELACQHFHNVNVSVKSDEIKQSNLF